MDKKKQDTSWDKVAGWYDQHVSESSDFHKEVIIPGALKLLDPKPGENILDLGCGQGVFCRVLAEKGVIVTGIDASRKLIDIAKKRSTGQKIEYRIADATKMFGFPDNIYDAIISHLALANMDPLEEVMKQAGRVIRPKGRFLIVINHPCFRIPRQSGWGYDEKRKLQYRRIDSYMTSMKIPIQMHPGSSPHLITWTFHRPISEYIDKLSKFGFSVKKLEEWTSHRESRPGKNARSENKARNEIPLFLALLCEKTS